MFSWLLGVGGDDQDTGESTLPVDAFYEPDVNTVASDITDDWLVIVEDLSSVRTIEIGDVLQQRVRSRPKLAGWDATEDALIESPLVGPMPKKPPMTYAAAARPSFAQAIQLVYGTPVQWTPPEPSEPRWTPAFTPPDPSALSFARAEIEAHYGADTSDSLDWCDNSRIARRAHSRIIRAPHRGTITKKVIKPRTRGAHTRPL